MKKKSKRDKTSPKWKPERFEKFWAFYRQNVRGEAREKAVKAWDKLKADDDLLDQMGQTLLRQMATEEWRRGIGLPYASSWLNGRRWEDTPPPERSGGHSAESEEDDGYIRETGGVQAW